MSQHKWLKLGAATFLSIGMLAACGDEDGDIQYEDPGADFEDGGDEGPAPEVNEGDGDAELDQNPEGDDQEEQETDEQLEDDMEEDQEDDSGN